MFEIEVTNNRASTKRGELLTKGQIGAQVQFTFNDHWTGMKKTAVFKRCGKTIDVMDSEWNGDIVTVPPEMTEEAGFLVHVGVYGVSDDGKRITPTLYAPLGAVALGAEPEGDPSTDPTLPVWAQLQEEIEQSRDHTKLENRDVADQHPMDAITGLVGALAGKQPLLPKNANPGRVFLSVEGAGQVEWDKPTNFVLFDNLVNPSLLFAYEEGTAYVARSSQLCSDIWTKYVHEDGIPPYYLKYIQGPGAIGPYSRFVITDTHGVTVAVLFTRASATINVYTCEVISRMNFGIELCYNTQDDQFYIAGQYTNEQLQHIANIEYPYPFPTQLFFYPGSLIGVSYDSNGIPDSITTLCSSPDLETQIFSIYAVDYDTLDDPTGTPLYKKVGSFEIPAKFKPAP